jgi:uncharacterized protein with PIN domain
MPIDKIIINIINIIIYKLRKEHKIMSRALVNFPVAEKQICSNCSMVLEKERLSENVIDITQDAYGIPTVVVRCPVCKTLIEWEMKCN